ncbi:MAG: histidyl-tRNA synthetase, histidyl-tRNA synthetase [Candidatus Parcubacteria bacterium]|jgi:histidyl-tRNA synthetase
MNDEQNRPGTEPYKGVRDFYPEDMAVQRYIFDTWAKAAESFGFARYDASVLEPAEMYRAKAAENEEIINEQTYTFIDKGDREVTLRPEMTPTVARMVAGKRRELAFPLRWYSIPNLFRYERPQRGRLREHWQLNADIFGSHDENADAEIIALASAVLTTFGAKASDFEICVNDRRALTREIGARLREGKTMNAMLKLLDTKPKMAQEEYEKAEAELLTSPLLTDATDETPVAVVLAKLRAMGITNAKYSPTIVRGFNYYTGTIFEIFDTNPENRRSLLGGGRYDNLTELFGGEPIPAVGFGMGDVTMRDFLETHDLLPKTLGFGPTVYVLRDESEPTDTASQVATAIRARGITVSSYIGEKKLGDQLKLAERSGATFALILTDSGMELKRLSDRSVTKGTLEELLVLVQKA